MIYYPLEVVIDPILICVLLVKDGRRQLENDQAFHEPSQN